MLFDIHEESTTTKLVSSDISKLSGVKVDPKYRTPVKRSFWFRVMLTFDA